MSFRNPSPLENEFHKICWRNSMKKNDTSKHPTYTFPFYKYLAYVSFQSHYT